MAVAIHRAVANNKYQFTPQELADMELAYIGGLLGLDIHTDEEARAEALASLANRRRASPLRKG